MGRHFQPNTIQHLWAIFLNVFFDVYIFVFEYVMYVEFLLEDTFSRFLQCWNVHLEIQEIQRLLSHFVSAQISLASPLPIAHCLCLLNSPSPTP